MHRGWGEEADQGGGVSGSLSHSPRSWGPYWEQTCFPQLPGAHMCSWFELRQWAQLPAGLGRQRGGSSQQALPPATAHKPSPLLARTASPGGRLHAAAYPLGQPSFLPLPPLSSLQLFPWQGFGPFRAAAPVSLELSTERGLSGSLLRDEDVLGGLHSGGLPGILNE